jgi:hypothetical protein
LESRVLSVKCEFSGGVEMSRCRIFDRVLAPGIIPMPPLKGIFYFEAEEPGVLLGGL